MGLWLWQEQWEQQAILHPILSPRQGTMARAVDGAGAGMWLPLAWAVSWSLLEFRNARNPPVCVSPAGTAPDHRGVNIDVFDSRDLKGHTQVTAWVFCQVRPTLPYLTCSKPEVVVFPKKHSSPGQPNILPPSLPLP